MGKAPRIQARRSQVRCAFLNNLGSLTSDLPPLETTRWRAISRVLRSPVDAVSCAVLPASCDLCGSPLPHLSSVPICAACWMEIPLQSGSVCRRCGDRLNAPILSTAPPSAPLCRTCRLAPPPFERAVCYGPYRDRMRAAIHALKYRQMTPAARPLGRMLAQTIGQFAAEAPAAMLLLPVPLHRSRMAQRGFNQAHALAEHALNALRKSHPHWRLTMAPRSLMRLRPTPIQAGLTARQRRLNVRGAFSVTDATALDGQHILLIDDIFTTGATVRAASLALLKAGAASVWVATLARAYRYSPVYRGSDIYFDDFSGMDDSLPADTLHQESILSSHDQPSF